VLIFVMLRRVASFAPVMPWRYQSDGVSLVGLVRGDKGFGLIPFGGGGEDRTPGAHRVQASTSASRRPRGEPTRTWLPYCRRCGRRDRPIRAIGRYRAITISFLAPTPARKVGQTSLGLSEPLWASSTSICTLIGCSSSRPPFPATEASSAWSTTQRHHYR
jgi:hypothetical protein